MAGGGGDSYWEVTGRAGDGHILADCEVMMIMMMMTIMVMMMMIMMILSQPVTLSKLLHGGAAHEYVKSADDIIHLVADRHLPATHIPPPLCLLSQMSYFFLVAPFFHLCSRRPPTP